MKKIELICLSIIFFSLIFASNSFAFELYEHDILYTIEPDMNHRSNCITVKTNFKEKSNGEYALKIPFGIRNIKIHGDSKKIKTEFLDSNSSKIKIYAPPNENIKLQYEFCQNNPSQNIHHPIIEENFIYLPLDTVLLFPESGLKKNSAITFKLEGFPKYFKTASSFNIHEKNYFVRESIEHLRYSFIAAGNMNINSHFIAGKPVHVVTTDKWTYFKEDPSHYIKKIINTQRKFWNDNNFPYYLVLLIQQKSNLANKTLSGMHRNNSIIALLPSDNDVYRQVIYTLSHEASHAWVTYKLKDNGEDPSLTWFFEGFNDLYGSLFSLKSGNLTFKQYLDNFDHLMKCCYFTSPISQLPFAQFKDTLNSGNEYYFNLQLRGHLAAKRLRDASFRGKNNLFDDAMKALLKSAANNEWESLTEEHIDKAFIKHVGKKAWEETKKLIYSGELITLSKDAFGLYATLTMVEIEAPLFGFDPMALMQNKVISGVRPNTKAYQAGLRNGQKVNDYVMDYKSTEKEVLIEIDHQGLNKKIRFFPEKSKKIIPQYVINKKLTSARRMKGAR